MRQTPLHRVMLATYYALVTPRNMQMPIWIGHPGGGKSESAKHIARALGVKPEHYDAWSTPQHEIEDYNGWKVPMNGRLVTTMDDRLLRLVEATRRGEPAFLLLDELGDLPQSKQAGALRFISERVQGADSFADVMMMGAMNPASTGTDSQEMRMAFANRGTFLHFPKFTPEQSAEYMLRGRQPEQYEFAKLDAARWEASDAPRAAAIYKHFILAMPDALYEDPESDQVRQRAPLVYCTPRSLTATVGFLATCLHFNDLAAFADLAVGTIGHERGMEFAAQAENLDLMDPEVFIADPDMLTPDPRRPDRTFAQLDAITAAACRPAVAKAERLARWNAGWKCIDRVLECDGDESLCLLSAQYLSRNKPNGALLQDVVATIQRIKPLLTAAGLDIRDNA